MIKSAAVLNKVNDKVKKNKTADNLEIGLKNPQKRTKMLTSLKIYFYVLDKKMMEIILVFELTVSFYNIMFEINLHQRKIFEKVIRER